MFFKLIKLGVLATAGVVVVGAFVFGRDAWSYAWTGASSVRQAVKDSVPIEFELKRARDLVNDIVPEMQANIRVIAQQEVEIAGLKNEIGAARQSLNEEQARLARLRDCLATAKVSFVMGDITYTRQQVTEETAHKLDLIREAEVVLAGKERLLQNRNKSLAAAVQTLDRARSQKTLLEAQIASLESQHRLIQAASVGSGSQVDTSKLAQTQQLITQIKKQLDVAERVLAHESKFVQPMQLDPVVDEKDLTRQVDEYLAGRHPASEATAAAVQGPEMPTH